MNKTIQQNLHFMYIHFQPSVKNCWLPQKHHIFCKKKKQHDILHSSEKIQISIIYKLLQIATKIYCKLRQQDYYKLRQKFIINQDKILLQITTANLLQILQHTNYDSYYKSRQVDYKLRQLLQITTEHTFFDFFPQSILL